MNIGELAKINFDWTRNGKKWSKGTTCLVVETSEFIYKLSGTQEGKQYNVMLPDGTIGIVYVGDLTPVNVER